MNAGGFALVLLTAVLTMAANLMIRSGIDAAGGFAPELGRGLLTVVAGLFMQPLFDLGFAVYFAASLVWFRVIASQPLSVAYPVLVSLTFMLVTMGAVVVFGESISLRKVLGLCVMLGGILLVSLDKGTP